MHHDIAFLHTAAVHESTFSTLLQEIAPELRAVHGVRPDLLATARTEGVGAELRETIAACMRTLASTSGASIVVCTCSTLGDVAESCDAGASFRSMRIDREMADRAVRHRGRILVVVALESTLAPTGELLRSSAKRQGVELDTTTVLCEGAWRSFETGDVDGYLDAVEATVREHVAGHAVVVLAQASMAPVAERCADLAPPVLCSPRPGVEAAVALLGRISRTATVPSDAGASG